jgi:hypothetical protein
MHEIYRTFAADFEKDRIREAAAFRLAREARPHAPGTSFVKRVRAALDRAVGQPAPAPTPALSADGSAACCP